MGRGFTQKPFGTFQRIVYKGLGGMSGPDMKSWFNLQSLVIVLWAGVVAGILVATIGGDALGLTFFWRAVVGFFAGVATMSVVATWLEDNGFIRR